MLLQPSRRGTRNILCTHFLDVQKLLVKLCKFFLYVCCVLDIIQADQSGTEVEILAEDGKPVSVDTVRISFTFHPISYIMPSYLILITNVFISLLWGG